MARISRAIAVFLVVACNGGARRTASATEDAPAEPVVEALPELTTPGYDFGRVRYYPEELGAIRQCDVAEAPDKRGKIAIVTCFHPRASARIELSWNEPMALELGDQLAVHIDAMVADGHGAEVRGHLIARRGHHPVRFDPRGPHGGCCDETHKQTSAVQNRGPGFDFEGARRDPVDTHHSCVVVWSAAPSPIGAGRGAIDGRVLSPELRWKVAVICAHPGGQSRITVVARSADVALSVQPGAVVDVKMLDAHGLIVEAGDWVFAPRVQPPWSR